MAARASILRAVKLTKLYPAHEPFRWDLKSAVRDGKKELGAGDADYKDGLSRLKEVMPPDPDEEFLAEQYEQASKLYFKISGYCPPEKLDAEIAKYLSAPWRNLLYVSFFDGMVQVDGMHNYFANRLDSEKDRTIKAFKAVNKKLALVVEKAFATFDTVKDGHCASRAAREPEAYEYKIAPAGTMPGRIDNDDLYDEIESEYLRAAGDIDEVLVKYLRKNADKLSPKKILGD